jgi:transposase-like protein
MIMPGSSSAPAGYRFPREAIAVAVRWYLRYGLSYRDVEELLAERGVTVDHVTVPMGATLHAGRVAGSGQFRYDVQPE